jgi:hypothetical protein
MACSVSDLKRSGAAVAGQYGLGEPAPEGSSINEPDADVLRPRPDFIQLGVGILSQLLHCSVVAVLQGAACGDDSWLFPGKNK